jgi:hypothetical protein
MMTPTKAIRVAVIIGDSWVLGQCPVKEWITGEWVLRCLALLITVQIGLIPPN